MEFEEGPRRGLLDPRRTQRWHDEWTYRGTDSGCLAVSGGWYDRGGLPARGDRRADVLYVEPRKYLGMGLSELRELRSAPWVQTLACFVVTIPFSRKNMVIAFSSR